MKVLIVDDDVVSRMMLMHMIDSAAAGAFDVLEAEDGEQAWDQLVAGAAPVLLFCDLRMPRLSGMELLARVKADARFDALPFVLVSAAGDAATMQQALGLGADGYIVKPFDGARVAAHLTRLLRAPRACAESGIESATEEHPEATLRRLGIDAARLALYLGGLQRQLEGAGTDPAQLARLAEGCRTLGLFGAAAGFDALQAAPGAPVPDAPAAPMQALAGARLAVLRQQAAMRALGIMPADPADPADLA
jgi:two-component system chemotaxis response regulator CheY